MIVIDNNAIHIVDSVMGTGKTQACIAWMRQHPEQKYLYVTPYLDECSRIQASAPELDFREPQEDKTKSADLLRLLSEGQNITTTHELLSLMKDSDVEYLMRMIMRCLPSCNGSGGLLFGTARRSQSTFLRPGCASS